MLAARVGRALSCAAAVASAATRASRQKEPHHCETPAGLELVSGDVSCQEELVDAGVAGELRVEGGGEEVALADEDGVAVAAGEGFDLRADGGDARGADEDHFERAAGQRGGLVEDAGVVLAAVGVALDGDVHGGERGLRRVGDVAREQDGAGAGAERGGVADERAEDVEEAVALEVAEEGGGFAAGDDEAGEGVAGRLGGGRGWPRRRAKIKCRRGSGRLPGGRGHRCAAGSCCIPSPPGT